MKRLTKQFAEETHIFGLNELLIKSVAEVLRIPTVGRKTVKSVIYDYTKEFLGEEWFQMLWIAMLEEVAEIQAGNKKWL